MSGLGRIVPVSSASVMPIPVMTLGARKRLGAADGRAGEVACEAPCRGAAEVRRGSRGLAAERERGDVERHGGSASE
jgi:hypothetical protein